MSEAAPPPFPFRLHPQQRRLLVLNALGGAAVLGSYYYGLAGHPGAGDALWGGVPEALKPFYTVSMLAAAVGYFPFTYLFVFRVDPDRVRIAGSLGFGWILLLYALILVPSAMWLPLTLRLAGAWSEWLWTAIRVVLALVGLGSLGILFSLIRLAPVPSRALHVAAIAGAIAFCVQTALLDATVWPAFYPTPTSAHGEPGS